MNQTVRTVLMWMVILVGGLLIVQVLRGYSSTAREIMFSEFLDGVASGAVSQVLIKSDRDTHPHPGGRGGGQARPRYDSFTYNPGYPDLIKDLRSSGRRHRGREAV